MVSKYEWIINDAESNYSELASTCLVCDGRRKFKRKLMVGIIRHEFVMDASPLRWV
jgi:hypothetical protein